MKYFGTDGIRGKVGEVITEELSYKLGAALIKLNVDTVVIGTDTRESKKKLTNALTKGALSVGLNVINANVVPTPALINYSKDKQILGVMITASHNPYYDNGLKVLNKGIKLSEAEELLIEDAIEENIISDKTGTLIEDDVLGHYLNFMKQFLFKSKIKVAIDCANGATYESGPKLFKQVTNDLFITANTPNGTNINNEVGSTHLNHIKHFMLENDCSVGFSFDGDGDRILAVEDNKVVDGDQIIFIIANYLKQQNKLNKDTLVLTQMSNLGILDRLNELKINYVLTPVGDKYVVRELMKNNYSIGGENSGHIIMPDLLSTGDGVLVALTLLKIMTETNKTLHQLLDGITMYADKMINLKVEDKTIINTDIVLNKIKEVETILKDGKVIVRASGTENLVRVSVMAKTQNEVNKYIKELVDIIGG
ncbi:MAG: phosphoglucosamine mutase [bacterium]